MKSATARTWSRRRTPAERRLFAFASTLRIARSSGDAGGSSTWKLTNAPSSLRVWGAPPSTTTA
jgi:hypothetical protein